MTSIGDDFIKSNSKISTANKIKFIVFLIVIALMLTFAALLIPQLKHLTTPEGRDMLISFIRGKGIWGVLILIGIQVMQVVIFILPGEIIEIAAGILYGTGWGYVLCTIGSVTGTLIIYYMVRLLGYSFITTLIPEEKFAKFKFLQNKKQLSLTVFILFFIPGTPKDLLTYFIPFTPMKLPQFLLLSHLARLPSVISSTFAGSALEQGRLWMSVLMFIAIGVIGIVGIIINNKFLEKKNQKQNNTDE